MLKGENEAMYDRYKFEADVTMMRGKMQHKPGSVKKTDDLFKRPNGEANAKDGDKLREKAEEMREAQSWLGQFDLGASNLDGKE